MSWLKEMVGGEVMPPFELDDPKVEDPAIPNRMVSTKSANRPFLTHKAYRRRQEALHAEWLKMKKERDDKIARGEEVGPLESDPTAVQEVGLLGLLKFVLYTVLVFSLAGKFITGSFVWGHESKWLQLKTYLPKNERLFSERMLAQFDGSDSTKPIYLAIDGDVYDVTQGKVYHPGGSYHILAGADAARAFATGCFKDHRTHDLRGLSDAELKSIEHWKNFYKDHKNYFKVGRVLHRPIDPSSPIPEDCDLKRAGRQHQEHAERERTTAAEKAKSAHHKEL